MGYFFSFFLWHHTECCWNAALVAYGSLPANTVDDLLETGPEVFWPLPSLAVPDGWEIPRVEVGEDLQRGAQPRVQISASDEGGHYIAELC